MNIKRIVFSEEAYEDLAIEHRRSGEALQGAIDNFISTMKTMVRVNKYIEGRTGDAIHGIANRMEQTLTQEIQSILDDLATNSKNFVAGIVNADVFNVEHPSISSFSSLPLPGRT